MRRQLHPLSVMLPLFVALALIYAYAVPILEAPDESKHVGLLEHLARTGELPIQSADVQAAAGTLYAQEGSQPPLYYLLAMQVYRLFDRSDFDAVRLENPHAIIGDPSARGNQNHILHDALYPPPLYGTALAIYAVRLFSIACAAVTVFAVYQAARLVVPSRPGVPVLAAGLVAFNPQFVFISASVNNDNLVAALNSLVIWQALVLMRDGFSSRRSVGIALLMAFASLTKLSGLVVIPLVGAVALWTAFRRRTWRDLLLLGVLTVGIWGIIAGWWYARNVILYGELFGTRRMLDIFGRRPAPPFTELITSEFTGLRMSFWGLFGWFNVFTLQPFYRVMDIVSAVGVVGVMAVLWMRRRDPEQGARLAFLIGIVAGGLFSLAAWTSQTAASQGRLMFAYIAAIAVLLAMGLRQWRIPPLVILIPLGMFAAAVPFITLIPTYAPPPALAALPATASVDGRIFRDWRLAGYQVAPGRWSPGDLIPITLYWQPIRRSDQDYSLFIRLLDQYDNRLDVITTYPGHGSLRTSTWEPGRIYADEYTLRVPDGIDLLTNPPIPLRAYVGYWKFPEGDSIDPVGEDGSPAPFVILDLGGLPTSAALPEPQYTLDPPIAFGDQVALSGYTFTDGVLSLHWRVMADWSESWRVFAFALDGAYADQQVVAQADAPPDLSTRYWRSGDAYMTIHDLAAQGAPAPGRYSVYIGWYTTDYPARLAVSAPGAVDNAYPVVEWQVTD
ncbi:MAG: glycosyltransferase family 39 protein [bacterium]|nr:glycosyltransferase family 39 protein [bacterium]